MSLEALSLERSHNMRILQVDRRLSVASLWSSLCGSKLFVGVGLRWEPSGSMRVRPQSDSLVLSYSMRRLFATEWKLIEQRVPITWTDCHFGG